MAPKGMMGSMIFAVGGLLLVLSGLIFVLSLMNPLFAPPVFDANARNVLSLVAGFAGFLFIGIGLHNIIESATSHQAQTE